MRYRIGVTVLSAAVVASGCAQREEAPQQPAEESQLETGLQGQIPLADQESGRSQRPYMWNMRLVGQQDIQNRGENGNLGWIGDCAYVGAYYGGTDPLAGMAVVDASNPTNPELVKLFPGTPGTRESQVEANEARKIVIVMPFRHDNTPYGDPPGPSQLQIYDASQDCKNPVRVSTYDFGDMVTHEHRISDDGLTVYATRGGSGQANPGEPPVVGPTLTAVDISDLANPTKIAEWDLSDEPGMPRSGMHDLDVNADGTRAYTNTRWMIDGVRHQGLTILDTSEVQARRPNPTIRRISSFNWGPPENFGGTHSAQLAHIKGRRYIIALDETMGGRQYAPPWGWGRILDITDEKYPLQISTIKLEASDERHASETVKDRAYYGAHYFGVDDVNNTSLLLLSWYSSGLRVWDIRDPYLPREIGYYIPGARTNTKLAVGSGYPNNKVDYVYSFVRYRPETGHIWFNSVFGGFFIAELIDNPLRSAKPAGN
jgi:hypothetical protein